MRHKPLLVLNGAIILINIAVLLANVDHLSQDIPGQGLDETCFVVANSDHSVRYEQSFLPTTVYFYGAGPCTIANPSPQKQSLVVYNYSTGETTSIRNKCSLKSDRYLVTIQGKNGQTMAETVLEICQP